MSSPSVGDILIGISSTAQNPQVATVALEQGEWALEVQDVRKSYGGHVALDGISVAVAPGTVLALLGPNGAGKTTLVSIIAGLRRADAGRVLVAGADVAASATARATIGLAPQETGVYMPLSVRDNLRLFGGLAGLRGRALRTRIDELAGALMLDGLLDRHASQLSGGERRRLHTAIALVHRPQLVLLDEPTVGADVQTRAQLLRVVRDLADDGAAVVYSTHYLQEVEALDPRVAFIDKGRIVASGTLAELVHEHGSSALELRFSGAVPNAARVGGAVVDGHAVRIPTDDPARTAATLLPCLGDAVDELAGIEIVQPTLDSVFLAVTGRQYHSEEVPAA